jgi:SNF2 family DNA or RNA helicase
VSYETNVGSEFYSPVLSESIRYDRATAYFSAKALAHYSKGLEVFARRPKTRHRLIISTEISEDDYNMIRSGYDLRAEIQQEQLERLRETITLDEEKDISNLSYLISLGVIEVKMAYTRKGIFHDKFGIVEDAAGNMIMFKGSNNETEAAISSNFESFDITCSWLSSEFDRQKIDKFQSMFDRLWEGEYNGVISLDMGQAIREDIMKFNKGRLIIDERQLRRDFLFLDHFQDTLFIEADPGFIEEYTRTYQYKWHLKKYVSSVDGGRIIFRDDLKTGEYKTIKRSLEQDSEKYGFGYSSSKRLDDHIESKEMHIVSRSRVGVEIRSQDMKFRDQYETYKAVVDENMARMLRDKQMWDSFFMCAMQKSGNFSVPGSGKTASVLGMYAYLRAKGRVSRIVVVGPKNSFGSWIDEFNKCFDGKETLRLFDCHDPRFRTSSDKLNALRLDSGNKNLLLFNYESLKTYEKVLKECIIDGQTMLVFDEVHRIKAVDGVHSLPALSISEQASYITVLTGTPIPNTYLDIYNLLHILYDNEYGDFFGFSQSELRNPQEGVRRSINQKIKPFFCRTTKSQLDVPPPNEDEIVYADPTPLENELFKAVEQKYGQNFFTLFIRLLQMESDPKMLLHSIDEQDLEGLELSDEEIVGDASPLKEYETIIDSIGVSSKTKECISTVKRLHDKGRTVIIWCVFVHTILNLERLLSLEGMRVKVIHGSVDYTMREEIIAGFKNKEYDVLISNPHTLAESVSLHTVCHDAVYFEYSYSLVHLLQSKDRIHRLGLADGQYTQYTFLRSVFDTGSGRFSMDKEIYDRLVMKENMMLRAIDGDTLEVIPSAKDDLEAIFKKF